MGRSGPTNWIRILFYDSGSIQLKPVDMYFKKEHFFHFLFNNKLQTKHVFNYKILRNIQQPQRYLIYFDSVLQKHLENICFKFNFSYNAIIFGQ